MKRTQNPEQTYLNLLSSPSHFLTASPCSGYSIHPKSLKSSWAKIIPSLVGEVSPEPSSIGEGREEDKEDEERKGVGKARNVPVLVNLSSSQF